MIQVHLWNLSVDIIHTTADLLGNHVDADEDTSQIKHPLCILTIVVLKACSAFFFLAIAHWNSNAES